MRTKNSVKNMVISFIANLLTILIGLIAQFVFVKTLGQEYLGINGLFNNIISMLGLVELGVGSAIIYNLYKPVFDNDKKKICSLLYFYRKCYNVIAIIVLLVGLFITPFLGYLTSDVTVDVNLNLVYILFVIDIFFSYILSYKRSIINAYQKNYIVNVIHILYLTFLNLFQTIILVKTKNYYLYLLIKIVMRIVENIIISIIANMLYPFINKREKLDDDTKRDIFKKVRALFFHKIGGFFVNGTDNILISKFIGIVQVGLYSNYYLIINAVNILFGQVIGVVTSSVGNLLVENNREKNYSVFKKIRFLNFWVASFSAISILIIMDDFITIWLGKEYILAHFILIVLVFNYFQKSMRNSYVVFKESAGIFYEDRFVPLIEAVTNIVASYILLKIFGFAGVFMGTIISGLTLWCYSYPKYVYKGLFNRNYISYFKETCGYILFFIVLASGSYYLSLFINFDNIYIQLMIKIILCLTIPNFVVAIIFCKTDNFKYYIDLIKKYLRKVDKENL